MIAHDLAGPRVEEGGDVARVVGRTAVDVATAETQSCNVILWRKNQLFVMICTVFFYAAERLKIELQSFYNSTT